MELQRGRSHLAEEDFQRSAARTTSRTSWRTKGQKGQESQGDQFAQGTQGALGSNARGIQNPVHCYGMQIAEPPAAPDLPTLIKEHLQSLPTDLKEAVEKIVEPDKPEPTLASKVKQAVGTLKQLSEKKASRGEKEERCSAAGARHTVWQKVRRRGNQAATLKEYVVEKEASRACRHCSRPKRPTELQEQKRRAKKAIIPRFY